MAQKDREGHARLSGNHERLPAFLSYGLFTVGVYVVVMSLLLALVGGEMGGLPLLGFSVGFSIFMLFYFIAMYVGWLFLT